MGIIKNAVTPINLDFSERWDKKKAGSKQVFQPGF